MKTLRSLTRAPDPRLSVLIPYYRDNPLRTLEAIAKIADERVDILAWDDGTCDPTITEALYGFLSTATADIRIFVCPDNQGRSAARNALVEKARSEWVLFLDADMEPTDTQFLNRYLDAIAADQGDVLFGGFTVEADGPRATRLHRELSRASDCAPAEERAAHGPQHVASSNLCVRRDVLSAESFDSGFTGWGWEDSEWAARVARSFRVVHLDNPALHLGLENDETLLRRFATSGPNYARFAERHPDFATGLPLYRHATRLSRVPGQATLRPVLRTLVSRSIVPIRLRILALKLWRASHYAEVVS